MNLNMNDNINELNTKIQQKEVVLKKIQALTVKKSMQLQRILIEKQMVVNSELAMDEIKTFLNQIKSLQMIINYRNFSRLFFLLGLLLFSKISNGQDNGYFDNLGVYRFITYSNMVDSIFSYVENTSTNGTYVWV